MKAIFLESQAKDCYVIGTNDELRKLLGACSHHKGLAPKPFVFRSGEVTYEFCKISDEEMDDLHVVCFEREFDDTKKKWVNNYLYSVVEPQEISWLLYDDTPTLELLYHDMRNLYANEITRVDSFSVDEISDWLQDVYS